MYHVRFRSDYPELLGAFWEGYERVLPWPLESDRQLDCFVIARLLMFANYVVNFDINPAKHLPEFEAKLKTLLEEKASWENRITEAGGVRAGALRRGRPYIFEVREARSLASLWPARHGK